MPNKKYRNIDVLTFLEEKMKSNTKHYQEDFEIDTQFIQKAASSTRPEDKTLLWLSRPNGTLCVKEHDAFIRDTAAHQSWRFYAEQTNDPVIAYVVELTGEKGGILYGNAYDLDYCSHVAQVADQSVPIKSFEKTFEDGHKVEVPANRSSYGFYVPLVEVHGPITDSIVIPEREENLKIVLDSQRRKRQAMQTVEYLPETITTIPSAEQQSNDTENIWITVYKDTLGLEDDLDNLTEICVPAEWLKKELAAEGKYDLEAWLDEYTADNTEFIARDALAMGKILACDDLNLFLPGEEGKINTRIEYLYRDAYNYKVWNDCVIKGSLSEEQKQIILDCRDQGEYFIPHLVGLPETRFDSWDDQSDHIWFELWDNAFQETTDPATVDITAEQLTTRFLTCKEDWTVRPSLSSLISDAQSRTSKNEFTPEPTPER